MIDERFGYRSGDWSDEACGDSELSRAELAKSEAVIQDSQGRSPRNRNNKRV